VIEADGDGRAIAAFEPVQAKRGAVGHRGSTDPWRSATLERQVAKTPMSFRELSAVGRSIPANSPITLHWRPCKGPPWFAIFGEDTLGDENSAPENAS